MYHYVLFDLDGTLTDPKEGICKSVQYALHAMDIEEPDLDNLERFIGPPLKTSYREFYGMDDEQCDFGVKKYRERYSAVGIFENEVYRGMKELLDNLQKKGVHMAIASSKPRPFVERILEHFELASYFEVVCGSDLDNNKAEKIDVMREALATFFDITEDKVPEADDENVSNPKTFLEATKKAKRMIPVDDVLMIGDRKFDVFGAKHFFLDSVGVTYGYAEEGELEAAEATYITDDLKQIYEIVTEETYPDRCRDKSAIQKSFQVLLPLVYDFVIKYGILFILQVGLGFALSGLLKSQATFVANNSAKIAVCFDALATAVCAFVFLLWYRREKEEFISKVVKRRVYKKLKSDCVLIMALGSSVAIFLNMIFSYIQMFVSSEAYKEVASVQYSVSIVTGLFIYGGIKPLAEELLFRGVIYGRMKRFYPVSLCIPFSALIFGAYHGNWIQLVYGFVMGCILAYLYEKYRSIYASLLFHAVANIVVFLISEISQLNQALFHITWVFVFGVLSVGLACIVWNRCKKPDNNIKKSNK